jgi:putative thiamine transport system permease protein
MDAPLRQLAFDRNNRRATGYGRRTAVAVHLGILGTFLVPIAIGLVGTALAAFGCLPAVGGDMFSLAPWRTLVTYPGFSSTLGLTVFVGLAATALSFALAIGFCAAGHDRIGYRRAEAMLAPLLASPHAAMAIGLAFVLAPSGWIARLISPWLTGWQVPPDVAIVGDPWGLTLIVALLVKEIPFILLMILAALYQIPADQHLKAAASLGYSPAMAWIKVILPQIYPQIRLPIYAVLAFSLSVVDMAIILGPSNPATLSVLAFRWFNAPDVAFYLPAASAAVLQLFLVIGAIAAWRLGELGIGWTGRLWIARGWRGSARQPRVTISTLAVFLLFSLGGIALLAMAIWSFASTWRYPEALPAAWTLSTWVGQLPALQWPARATLWLGLLSTLVSICLVIAWLECEDRGGVRMARRALWLIYIPLVIPQISFLFAIQVLLIRVGLDGTVFAVVWAHLIFVLPYVFLSLADPWRALDSRYARSAAALGASPLRALVTVKLPMLLRPILIACAIGFSVSVAQYLPTLFAGNGRVATLTTEAVTLASGADRRIVGVYTFLQSLMPFLAYALALSAPALVFMRRRALLRPT